MIDPPTADSKSEDLSHRDIASSRFQVKLEARRVARIDLNKSSSPSGSEYFGLRIKSLA